jgi:hypothetical protein
MRLVDAFFIWLRYLAREEPTWYHGEDQIAVDGTHPDPQRLREELERSEAGR